MPSSCMGSVGISKKGILCMSFWRDFLYDVYRVVEFLKNIYLSDLRDEFNESKQLIFAIYNLAVMGSILLIVNSQIEMSQGAQRVFFAFGVFWTTCLTSLPIFCASEVD
mmetsp:Transcript_37850/g.64604  ORF Transcript_37850/g.64604 Transcript_37850/m.64604 type:complete len:109 (-) Transcript_37850:306-632(-)